MQQDLFQEPKLPPITIVIQGIEVPYKRDGKMHVLRGVPSFKTGKTAIGWLDKLTNRIQARPLTLPEHKKWMELATRSIECQLRSCLQITGQKIQTVASARSWIASRIPLDDSWTWCTQITVNSRLCQPGEKPGAIMVIERIQ